MVWEFASSLENNYNQLDTLPKHDNSGKRVIKSIYPKKRMRKESIELNEHLKDIVKQKNYDPSDHPHR